MKTHFRFVPYAVWVHCDLCGKQLDAKGDGILRHPPRKGVFGSINPCPNADKDFKIMIEAEEHTL